MENQEGDELLLSRARWTGGRPAAGTHIETTEQVDPKLG